MATKWAGFTDRRPQPRIIPLTPKVWPQDKLRVPNGYGDMTPIARSNKYVGREFYVMTFNFSAVANGTIRSLSQQVDASGDLWVVNISAYLGGFQETGGGADRISIEDVKSGYNLFSPSIPANFLATRTIPGTVLQSKGSRGTLPQPFPFLRDSVVKVTLDSSQRTFPGNVDYQIMLEGWREYQNASH